VAVDDLPLPSTPPSTAPAAADGGRDPRGAEAERQTLLRRLASLSDVAYSDLLTVPAEHALERLGATSVSLSRWERDRGILRCLVNVGALAPGEERFPTDETYELAEWDSVLDLARGHGSAYQLDDPELPEQGRLLLERLGHRSAVSVPIYVGDRLWGELWATRDAVPFEPGGFAAATEVAVEVSSMVALAERLEHMARLAFQDALTGLGNRRQLDDTLDALLGHDGPGTTVVVCDVNDLKRVNDEHGHEAGDKVIIAVADALSSAVAPVPGAVAARLGGDEFALLLPGAQRSTAILAVENAARTLAARATPVTISCGIAVVAAGASVRDALSVADAAQYSAKRRGSLLFVAAGLEAQPDAPRRRFRDQTASTHADAGSRDAALSAARALVDVAHDLGSAPSTALARLVWLAERLVAGFELDHWSLSTVDLAGERTLRIRSLGLRTGRPAVDAETDLLVDVSFPLASYPLSERAVLQNAWFTVDVDDDRAEPAERAVLLALGKRYLLALGCSDATEGLLLEMYGRGDHDIDLLGSTMALAAGALLERPLPRLVRTAPV
jgi:diguanylate cyclase (GGDEF)-like protein